MISHRVALGVSGKAAAPPVGSDIYWNSVVLAMPFDGANNSTTFTDLKGKTITRYGDAKISTTTSKFGGSSAYFDGSEDCLTVPDSSDWIVSGSYTIELWVYIREWSWERRQYIVSAGDWSLWLYQENLSFMLAGSTTEFGHGLPINTWHHIAFVKSGGYLDIYIDGILAAAAYGSNTSFSTAMVIGNSTPSHQTQGFHGYIDDLRITKGVARYTSEFSPPTTSYFDDYD